MADDTESHSTGIRESRDTLPAEVVESALAVCQKATETCLSKILQIAIDDAISHILRDAGTGSIEEQQASHRIAGQLSDRLDAVRQHTFEEFELLFSGKKALHGDLGSTDEMDELGLSLVDHESLEHQIVIERVATRAQGDTKSDFSLLNRRFCLLKDRRIKPEDSPLSAKALTHCISQGVAACDIGVMGQLAVFRSIENFLGDQLKHLYLALNAQLVELGVLPDIKHHIWRTDSTLRAGRARVDLAESQKAVLKEMRRPTQGEDLVALLKQLAGDPAASVVDEAGSPGVGK